MKKTINLPGATPETWARTIWFFIGLIGQLCVVFHLAPLPEAIANLNVDQLTVYITTIVAVSGEIRAWWKNNSFSEGAQLADAVMKAYEQGELEYSQKAYQPDTDHYTGRG